MPRPRYLACFLLLIGPLLVHVATAAEQPGKYQAGKHGRGELRYINGLPVLLVQGTPEEIGEQRAALTAEVAKELIDYPRDLLRLVHREDSLEHFLEQGRRLLPQFPKDHLRELETFAKFAGVDRDMLIGVNTLVDTYRGGFGCSSLLVDGSRSVTRGPLFGRNLDFVTLGKLQHYCLVEICRPEGKRAFCSIAFPGMLGTFSGINDAGLAVAVHEVYLSKDGSPMFSPKGTPYTFLFRRILEECSTVGEAEKLARSLPRTTRLNLAVCDPKQMAVFEMTPLSFAVRGPEEGILVCTNHFRTPDLAWILFPTRYKRLSQARSMPTLTVADVARKMHEVNQGALTVQTMVFEPETLVLHLAIGDTPSSALPLKRLELSPLLKRGEGDGPMMLAPRPDGLPVRR